MDAAFAKTNLDLIRVNPYPGRGLVIGVNDIGTRLVQIYWVMGRSENSRNRVMTHDNGCIFTEPADPAKVKDPSLIIYNAMLGNHRCFVVSNGHQTDAVLKGINGGSKLASSLSEFKYEPDGPNYTPRITGVCDLRGRWPFSLSVLRKSAWSDSCDRLCYYYESIANGFGFCITTYSGNGNPLPSFYGEPMVVPLSGDIVSVAERYWDAINDENKVSLAVRFIAFNGLSQIKIINKYQKVS